MMRRLLLAALAAAALALFGCGSSLPEGPAGTVVSKDKDSECHKTGTGKSRHKSCHDEFELTTRDKKGDSHEFEVTRTDYDDCYRGSAYPKCTKR